MLVTFVATSTSSKLKNNFLLIKQVFLTQIEVYIVEKNVICNHSWGILETRDPVILRIVSLYFTGEEECGMTQGPQCCV